MIQSYVATATVTQQQEATTSHGASSSGMNPVEIAEVVPQAASSSAALPEASSSQQSTNWAAILPSVPESQSSVSQNLPSAPTVPVTSSGAGQWAERVAAQQAGEASLGVG